MPGKIIALVGPSGVGKNFAKEALKTRFPQLSELTVFTTRNRRPSDGADRKTDISVNDFLKMQKEERIIAAHQPFGPDGDWYGFSKEQINELLKNEGRILTEIHPDNISLFKELYSNRVFIIALIANKEYLEHNLKARGSEKDIDMTVRLDKTTSEVRVIKEMQEEKLIDKIIEVNWDNKDKLAELIINEAGQEIMLSTKKKYKTKLK